ncbi:hypothetical protein MsAg5_09390 [Methanosarcinaceae archaeon Ag5]|uniref:Tetratricopeptide repeat protein n=1 Tax=Methanolapillus africanus TaxID=3028297 RepID=A0AAE4MJK9_9EURY|nr:hypothetical protein [Methanosarcinaceae archaeon Ag5]
MDQKLMKQLEKWHNNFDNDKIIRAVLEIPEAERDYELTCILARAYNNNDEYDKAIQLLLSVKEQGENDPLWFYRLAYAYFYLDSEEQALELLKRSKELDPDNDDVDELIHLCEEYLSGGENDIEAGLEADSTLYDYTAVVKHDDSISVCFYIEHEKAFAIGEKMYDLNEEAYMNGYNWEAFFNYYLPKYEPDVMDGMDTDPEAGMYVAFYDLTPENEARAEKFIEIIRRLVDNEDELYRIVREESDNILWD